MYNKLPKAHEQEGAELGFEDSSDSCVGCIPLSLPHSSPNAHLLQSFGGSKMAKLLLLKPFRT